MVGGVVVVVHYLPYPSRCAGLVERSDGPPCSVIKRLIASYAVPDWGMVSGSSASGMYVNEMTTGARPVKGFGGGPRQFIALTEAGVSKAL